MQGLRRVGKVTLTGCLTVVFLVSSLLPKQRLRPAYAVEPVPIPLPAVEDPLGQQPEQSTPEISVNVDVRDGHLTVRVVDLWGPGRVPLVYRSYTNGTLDPDYQPSTNPAPYRWQFPHPLDIIGTDVLEEGGVRSVYRWSHNRSNPGGTELWQVYVSDTGASTNAIGLPAVSGLFRTMEMHYTCDPGGGGNTAAPAPAAPAKPVPGVQGQVAAAPPGCVWDNTHVVYLPKGIVRRYLHRKLVEERDANGNVTTFTYTTFGDGYGRYLSTVTDPVGRQLTYAWEHDFQKCVQMSGGDCVQWKWVYRVRQVTDPYGRFATYSYNSNGLMTSVLNGAGRTTSYTYEPVGFDSLGRLLSVTNARGHTTSVTWAGGRVTQVTAPGGATTVYTYTVGDGEVRRTVVRDALTHATTYDMYAGVDPAYRGNLEAVTDPLGHITRYAYDTRHNVTQVTDPRGYRTTYQYTSRNKVTQVVQAVGSLNLTTTATWDANDNLLSLTNPRGIRTEYAYNSAHKVTSIRRAVGTADESLTQYTYNSWGGVASVIDPLNHTTSYTYTARRQIQTVTPPVGGTTSYGYNSADDQVTMTNGNGRTWTTAYDLSRLVTSVTDPQNHMIRYEYDNNGNRVRTYDGKNQLTMFNYDNRDRLTSIVDPLNGTTAYQYDAGGESHPDHQRPDPSDELHLRQRQPADPGAGRPQPAHELRLRCRRQPDLDAGPQGHHLRLHVRPGQPAHPGGRRGDDGLLYLQRHRAAADAGRPDGDDELSVRQPGPADADDLSGRADSPDCLR